MATIAKLLKQNNNTALKFGPSFYYKTASEVMIIILVVLLNAIKLSITLHDASYFSFFHAKER